MPGATTFDKLIVAAVAVLIAAFTLGALGPMVSQAIGDDVTGKRDDDAVEVEAIDDDDDDDDRFNRAGTRTGDTSGRAGSGDSGSRSIGSNSANTRTGTTRGTGVSKTVSNTGDKSRNTKTGTTRGTGPSKSVSNSS